MEIRDGTTERERALVVAGFARRFRGSTEPSHRFAAVSLRAKQRRRLQSRDHSLAVSAGRGRNVDYLLHHRASNHRRSTFRCLRMCRNIDHCMVGVARDRYEGSRSSAAFFL
jgi:hypothetical protein